ncbi:MAG: formimidoylglutamase [Bdellovibrionaceae bacterium]|nr:formimidoylglutamase [Pseudobdellovibrionaceae bacterium]
MSFKPCSLDLFFKSTKPSDPRLGEQALFVKELSPAPTPTSFVIAGFPDDEGIRINGGRPGAEKAPDTIRKYLYKMTAPAWRKTAATVLDVGNLSLDTDLALRHQEARQKASAALTAGHRWIGLGGGHDYGFSDGAGFLDVYSKNKYKPLIINFDAHLDVRDTSQGLSSGTPFYRLLMDYPENSFEFIEIGIQSQCNSTGHYEWALKKNAKIITLDDILPSHLTLTVLERIAESLVHPRPTFLSVDIDAFSSAFAPGCSQSWSTGLEPNAFFVLLDVLLKRLDVRSLGIYEVSPPLDTDDRTAKLAAQIAHRFIYS